METKSPRIKIQLHDRGAGPMYFSVENAGRAYDFMVSLDRFKPTLISVGPGGPLKAFEWSRLGKFLEYAKAQGIGVSK